ncbi:hypothetical protein H0E87_031541 [Populus deltoides]|uniref:Uncharacterized protein n=1 Tax=Populus deltoides TaxID=3696 RepID=A0A8T2WGQ8_POPDE|nr:hypothetical protein H0E87_031541 [Populus deltoides]
MATNYQMRNDGREPVLMEFLGVKVDKVAGSLFIWRSPSSEAFDYACAGRSSLNVVPSPFAYLALCLRLPRRAFMQRVSNYPSSKMEVSLQKIRYLGKAIGTEYNSPYKDSEPFWNFFPPTPRRKAFFDLLLRMPIQIIPLVD